MNRGSLTVMTSFDVTIPTADGTCNASMSVPEGSGPWPAVIMYPDAGGLRESFRAMGARLADQGYVVIVPNVYYRTPYEPFSMATAFSDEGERKRLFGLMSALTPEMVVRDTGAILDFLAARPDVRADRIGTTGYCMGGRLSLVMAGNHPERIAAAASFHGGRLAVADDPWSPHHFAAKVKAAVFVGGAHNDASYTDDDAKVLGDAYAAAGVDATLEIFPALHGYAVPDNPTYDEAAAERHWTAMTSLFGRVLAP